MFSRACSHAGSPSTWTAGRATSTKSVSARPMSIGRALCQAVSDRSVRGSATTHRLSFAALALFPEDVRLAGFAIENAGGDEEQVRQAVQVLKERRRKRIRLVEPHEPAFGSPADGARKVSGGGALRAARQHEIPEGRQLGVECIELAFEAL